MQILEKKYPNIEPLIDLNEICPKEKLLFVDIETTGLSKEKTSLYLIGCGYYTDNAFCTKLFFADNPSEELNILNAYLEFGKSFTHLIHFNGTKFDIPYLRYKADKYNIEDPFKDMSQIDVYQLAKPLRQLLFPSSMRQKCIEDFLEITREDMFNGGELINVYHSYVESGKIDDFNKLITHNEEDVLGMHKIMPILKFLDLKNASLTYLNHEINEYSDYLGECKKELIITFKSSVQIYKSFTSKTNTLYLKANSDSQTMTFRLPIISGQLNHYFENYRDYVYLPSSDICIHKNAAMGLNKKDYVKATRENCFQKVHGDFIKQPDNIYTPVLKTAYKDKAHYCLLPDFDDSRADEFGTELLNVFFKRTK